MWYIIGFFVLAQLVVFLIRKHADRLSQRHPESSQPCGVLDTSPLHERLRRVRSDFASRVSCRRRPGWRERFHLRARRALRRLAYFRRDETQSKQSPLLN